MVKKWEASRKKGVGGNLRILPILCKRKGKLILISKIVHRCCISPNKSIERGYSGRRERRVFVKAERGRKALGGRGRKQLITETTAAAKGKQEKK